MKKIVFLVSLSLSVAVVPAASLAKLVLDLPPVLAAAGCNPTCTGCDASCVNPCITCCACPDPCDPSCTNPCPGSCCPVSTCDPCAGGSYDPDACVNSCKKACCNDACDPCVLSSCEGTDPCTACAKFNDTGIDVCRGTSEAEDCKHGRDADAKTNGSGDGRVGFSLVKEGLCIRDNVTGLLWSPDKGQYAWSGIQAAADGATDCGFSDWRLPTVKELVGIVSYHSSTKAADDTFDFPATYGYWSGTQLASDSTYAWSVSFANGLTKQTLKTSGQRLRLVRTAE